ncbi:hypothetical protein Pse7367_0226 [Thalassoporum mexicanum PCC 7367]|uniref:hypothetical protein n=1 Tax=Thalassoporum mexicanum TaxID=3457544 RepID=UPI00029FC687|nr:hypothetical protein [Pseudanabaena sp. PCC 7367]AFY68543.1 hypothetical protein Pse7367_0226 [Pseudanabaena sp. PCC 7367]
MSRRIHPGTFLRMLRERGVTREILDEAISIAAKVSNDQKLTGYERQFLDRMKKLLDLPPETEILP